MLLSPALELPDSALLRLVRSSSVMATACHAAAISQGACCATGRRGIDTALYQLSVKYTAFRIEWTVAICRKHNDLHRRRKRSS